MLATKSNSYTFQKSGVWYFSRRVPNDLRRHYRTGRISKIIFSTIFIIIALITQPVFAGVDKDVDVRKVQTILTELCFKPGPVDGAWGKKTERAVEQFFDKYFDGYTGQFGGNEFSQLINIKNMTEISSGTSKIKRCGVRKSQWIKKGPKRLSTDGVTLFDRGCCEITDNTEWQPNDATLSYYYQKTANLRFDTRQMYKVRPASNPAKFKRALEDHKVIEREMANKTILSYLYYDDGAIVYDALPPSGRFDINLSNRSYFPSHSMGKSITSYLIGHAICQGYIKSIDAPIENWPLMENTLYYGQPLINLLNMKAGDTHIIKSGDGNFIKTGRSIHGNAPLLAAVQNPLELKNTSPRGGKRYAYSNLTADVIFNYMMHRVGNDFDRFISNFYQDKVKIEYPVYLWMNPITNRSNSPSTRNQINEGAGQYGISATRYDFLRIAKAIMGDWQNDTCEGKYLKEIYKRRVHKNNQTNRWDSSDRRYGKTDFNRQTRRYGGQFHLDVVGLSRRNILVLNGYNGQQIIIDMDNSRIVVIGAVKAPEIDSHKLGFEPIMYGRIR